MIPFFSTDDRGADPLERLCRADEAGLLIAPGESAESFVRRIERMRKELPENLPAGLPEVTGPVREKSEEITFSRYGFRASWLPAYYSIRETGHFSAGVSVILDDLLPLVYLSGAFLKKARHRGYDPAETLAHESVHAARTAFPENSSYDEYFPCQVHASPFRRLAGNLFRRWYIPLLFFLGLNPFLFILPLGILTREVILLRRLRIAREKLRSLGLRPDPVLLRLSDAEIRDLAAGRLPACLTEGSSLRRQLFFRRFALH